ncbi:MAG: hypothetical protein JW999_09950 [Methanotrichaceae archaeon]|nr:hypothetical protein [Methanotrichaceae archaeon]
MPKLGDYIGHLLSEITIARMQADLEAVRVAELYAGHPLLRNMPVPRFRMPDVEMDVPIVVKELEEPPAGESPHGNPPIAEMRKVFDKVLTSILSKENIRLNAAVQNKLKIILDKRVIALTRPTEIAIDMNRVSQDFSINAVKAMGEVIKPEMRAEFEETLKDSLRIEFIKIRKPPTRLNVLVTTAEIREAGPNEVITHLHLKISEESFEWTTIESDEGKNDRLVIE